MENYPKILLLMPDMVAKKTMNTFKKKNLGLI